MLQASDPLGFMHPPVVVPDALRLSGLAALSGIPLHGGGGDPNNALSATVALSNPALGQPQGHQQLAGVPAAEAALQHGEDDKGDPAAAAHRGPVPPTGGRRRPAEQPAAPQADAKRRRKHAAAGQLPADLLAEQQQQPPDHREGLPTALALIDGPDAAEAADAGRGAAQGADPPNAAEPMEVDASDTAATVRTRLPSLGRGA